MDSKNKDAPGVLPDGLTQSIRAYQESRVILTAVELDLFTAAGDGATAAAVAATMQTDLRATEMLMNALVALGLLSKQDGRFRNTSVAARYFTAGSPDDSRAATMHTAHLWRRWSTLTECVRAGSTVAPREAAGAAAWTESFIAAMHRNACDRAPHVVRAVGAGGVRRMLDIGGGSGAYSIEFARASPQLHSEILDRPEVLEIARRYIERAGMAARVATRPGDLKCDDFGQGYDLLLLSAICHMLGPDENLELLRRCLRALAPDGRIVIQDFILNEDKTSPKNAALFSLNMLVGTQKGASYSEGEYADWLRRAGFREIRRIPLDGPTGLMTGAR